MAFFSRQRIRSTIILGLLLAAPAMAAEQGASSSSGSAMAVSDFAAKHVLKEVRSSTVTNIAAVLEPFKDGAGKGASPGVTRALDVLRQKHFEGATSPPRLQKDLVAKLSAAVMLGPRGKEFLPDLAWLNDEALMGKQATKAAILDIWQKAGRKPPADAEMDKMIDAVKDARGSVMQPPQNGDIPGDGYNIQIDSSPAAGRTQVSVTVPDGQDGKPERVTFSARQFTQEAADHNNLEAGLQPDPPRDITAKESEALREDVNGDWVDQDGTVWKISGSGDSIVFTNVTGGGHTVEYKGTWALGMPTATHIVDNVADMDGGLPDDVKAQLASQYHPPFTIRLEYNAQESRFEGVWISGQVTYSGMTHDVRIVEDPSWDKPLILTRKGDPDYLSYGAKADDHI